MRKMEDQNLLQHIHKDPRSIQTMLHVRLFFLSFSAPYSVSHFISVDTTVVKVEPHPTAAEEPAPTDEPLYSKVMKVKSQRKPRENPYEEPEVSPAASPLSTVVAKLDFSSASHTSDIVQMMSAAADEDKVNDSLYDSIRQPPQQYESNEQEATDELQFNPAFYKGLQRHDQTGNIHLIAVRGTSELLDSANVNFTHGGSPGMRPIHYAAGSGNKKALREILSSLPPKQDPVERVIGSRKLDRPSKCIVLHCTTTGCAGMMESMKLMRREELL